MEKKKTEVFDIAPKIDTLTKTKEVPAVKNDTKTATFSVEDVIKSKQTEEEQIVLAPLYELARTSSVAHAAACRRFVWFDIQNLHLLVYIMFCLVLSVFSLYYLFFNRDTVIGVFALIAACFMLYVIIRGPSLFSTGMAFDEERSGDTLVSSFYDDSIKVTCGDDAYILDYNSVIKIRFAKNYILLKIKGDKFFKNGLLLEKPADKDTTEGLIQLVKDKMLK